MMTPLRFEQMYQDEWTELEALLDRVLGRKAGNVRASLAGFRRSRRGALPARVRAPRAGARALLPGLHRRPPRAADRRRASADLSAPRVRARARLRRSSPSTFRAPSGRTRRTWPWPRRRSCCRRSSIGLLVYWRPELILSVVSSETAASFEEMYSPSADSIGRTRTATTDWMMFGFYIRNNIGVAFQCFAGGLFAGLGTLFFLAYNGAFSGALAGYLTERGLSSTFYSFIATHSAFELTAIVLSGAAGLRIGHALLAPGRLTRLQSLVQATRDSAVLLYGVTAMLLVAAAIEAFWSSAQLAAARPSSTASPRSAGPPCSATSPSRGDVQVDALAVRLRPRTPMEAADLGVRLCQSAARSVYRCYGVVALPVLALALASFELASWLPAPGDLVREAVARSHDPLRPVARGLRAAHARRPTCGARSGRCGGASCCSRWTVRRLSPWRSLTQPVYQLEGLSIWKAGARVRQIRRRAAGSALMMTHAFSMSETALTFALRLARVLVRAGGDGAGRARRARRRAAEPSRRSAFPIAYAIAVLFLEPFYVAAGFAMYLNRRAELEAGTSSRSSDVRSRTDASACGRRDGRRCC